MGIERAGPESAQHRGDGIQRRLELVGLASGWAFGVISGADALRHFMPTPTDLEREG
ncbi:MAG TPA: hypothetical protein VIV60_02480 [Polyangiaceae bacterium]